jgi:ribosome recycling factor
MTDIESIYRDVETRMQRAIESFISELAKLRTGRAHPSLIENLRVHCYGNDSPLNQVASIVASDARTLMVSPWDKSSVAAIEKAIGSSGLGLNPISAGLSIRVPLPALTEERRRDLTKVVKQEAENARIAVRNLRREANSQFKELLKNKVITEDVLHRAEERTQKLTDKSIADIDKHAAVKETELLDV